LCSRYFCGGHDDEDDNNNNVNIVFKGKIGELAFIKA
jgi:hypothetical protein